MALQPSTCPSSRTLLLNSLRISPPNPLICRANAEVRHTVPLAKPDGSLTTMEVTLVTYFMPMPAVNILKAVKTLEHFRLELDKPDAIFTAGKILLLLQSHELSL